MLENHDRSGEKKNSAIVASVLSAKLLDDNLMSRYGTSLSINMGKEYQKYLDEKYLELKNEFDKINKNSDDVISMEELTDFINTLGEEIGRTFDEKYMQKVFNLVDVDHNKVITIQEFITCYIILEEKLRLKKIKLQKLDDDLRQTKEKYLKGMNESKGERISQEGLSDSATITVNLLEAKDLKPMDYNGASDPYVILSIGEKKFTSTYKNATLEPVWNEDFTFRINKRNQILKVDVYDKDQWGGDDYEGGIELNIEDFADQHKHDVWFNLKLNGEYEGNGQIRLRIQYMWSRFKFCTDHYNKTDLQIQRLQEDITELNRYFELFQKPFGIILYGEIENIIDKRVLERSEDVGQYMASSRKSIYASPKLQVHKGNIVTGLTYKMENAFRETLRTTHIEWGGLTQFLMYSIVALSCLCLLDRSDFVNLLIGIAIWILFIREKKMDILDYLKYLLIVVTCTVFYDFLWLYLHYSGFWQGSQEDKAENAIKKITYVFSFLNFVAKIVLSTMLWMQYLKATSKRKSSNPNVVVNTKPLGNQDFGSNYMS